MSATLPQMSDRDREELVRRIATFRAGSVTKYNESAVERSIVHGYVDVVIMAGWRPLPHPEPSLFERVFGSAPWGPRR